MNKGEWFDDSVYEDFSAYDDPNAVSLRDWQRRAKKFFFKANGQCIFEVATGSGKTFGAIDIMQDLLDVEPNLRILIIVPKNVILETGWYKELSDAGIPIQKIGVYYGEVKEYAQITLTNMQSINRIPLELFDMCIMDEIHNYGTKRMLEFIKHPFKYKLGLSATLKRMDHKHYEILKLFNYEVFTYNPQQALSDGVLNPFDFTNIGVRLDGMSRIEYDDYSSQLNTIFKSGGSYNAIMRTTSPLKFKMLSVLNNRKSLVNNYHEKFEIARQIILKHKHDKVIVFNQFNEQTSKMYWHLLEDDIECRIIHSGVDKQKREQSLMDFKNDKFNVLLTSKVLDEGYNLPKLDVAIIMAGDSTDKQTVQRMGRVLRKKKGKNSKLYQIFCIDTIESRNAEERAKIFKSLSSDYNDITFITGTQLNL
jgi:superfamily II DNA or RNA helicase